MPVMALPQVAPELADAESQHRKRQMFIGLRSKRTGGQGVEGLNDTASGSKQNANEIRLP